MITITKTIAKELYESYQRDRGCTKTSTRRSLAFLEVFLDYASKRLKLKDIRETTRDQVVKFLTWLERTKSKRTGKRYAKGTRKGIYSAVKGFFKCLYINELSLRNPAQDLGYKPKGKTSQRPIMTIKELGRFLDNINEDSFLGLRDRAIFELVYSSGLRGSEIENLNIDDIDFRERMLHVRQGKGSKDRVVPIGEVAFAFLKRYLSFRKDREGALFLGNNGRLLESAMYKRFVKLAKEKNIYRPGLCLHSIRHSAAVHLLSNGADLRYVQELLGHESIETTVIYTRELQANLARKYRKYHPGENDYRRRVDEEYLERLSAFEDDLKRQKKKTVGSRGTKKRYYEKKRQDRLTRVEF